MERSLLCCWAVLFVQYLLLLTLSPCCGAETDQTDSETLGKTDLPPLIFQPYVQQRVYGAWAGNQSDKGMDLLYTAVNSILEELQPNGFPHNLLSDNDLRNPENLLVSFKENYLEWLKYEQGYLLAGGICLVLSVIFTLLYIIYGCCRCCFCRRDSGKPRADGKCDACKRRAYTGVLAVFTVIMIFTVACALISNQYVHEAANRLPDKVRFGLEDLEAYKDETNRRVKTLLITDYSVLNRTILKAVEGASEVVVNRVKKISGAASLRNLSAISERALKLERNLTMLERDIEIIEQNAVGLKFNMSRLHGDAGFQNGLRKCLNRSLEDSKKCTDVDSLLNQYKDLPEHMLDFGKFVALKNELQALAKYNISAILSEIDLKPGYSMVDDYKNQFQEYEFYRWIAGIVMGSLLGLMVVCFGLGLFYGICGKRPSYYEDDCCVRSTGSKLYCGGVTLGILFLAVFMCVACCLFLVGANSQNLICDPIYRPNKRQDVYEAVQRFVNLHERSAPSDLTRILRDTEFRWIMDGCEKNETLYEIFNLEEQLGISDILNGEAPAYKELAAALDSLKRDFQVEHNLNSMLISEEAEQKLERLKNMDVGSVPPQVIEELEEKLKSLDILSDPSVVESEVNRVIGREMDFLREFVSELKKLERNGLRPLKQQLRTMIEDLRMLNEQLPHLTRQVPRWISLLRNAQGLLATNLTGYINSVASQVTQQMRMYVDEYRLHIKEQLSTNVTSCGPLKAMGRASAMTLCDRLLYPFNSYWASIIVCLLLVIPSIMLATSLIDLYKNTERYCKANYYSDTAEIPLNGLNPSSTSRSRGRSRVSAYVTDDYDHYSRVDGAGTKPHGSSTNGYANWRTPSNSSYLDTIGSPPPPYSSPERRNR